MQIRDTRVVPKVDLDRDYEALAASILPYDVRELPYKPLGGSSYIRPRQTLNLTVVVCYPTYLSLERIPFSGGHVHGAGSEGELSQTEFFHTGEGMATIYPFTYTAPEASGLIIIRSGDGVGHKDSYSVVVQIPGLVSMSSRPSIVLTGATGAHPANHYGRPDFVRAIENLADQFFAEFSKPLFVNDMSLPDGGLFDIHGNWSPPHQGHRDGVTVDISSNVMSTVEKQRFRELAEENGIVVYEHTDYPPHFHVHF